MVEFRRQLGALPVVAISLRLKNVDPDVLVWVGERQLTNLRSCAPPGRRGRLPLRGKLEGYLRILRFCRASFIL